MNDSFSHGTNSRIERQPGGTMHWLTQLEFRIWVWVHTVSYSGLIYVCGVRVPPRAVVRGKGTNGSELEPIDCYRHTWMSLLLLPGDGIIQTDRYAHSLPCSARKRGQMKRFWEAWLKLNAPSTVRQEVGNRKWISRSLAHSGCLALSSSTVRNIFIHLLMGEQHVHTI